MGPFPARPPGPGCAASALARVRTRCGAPWRGRVDDVAAVAAGTRCSPCCHISTAVPSTGSPGASSGDGNGCARARSTGQAGVLHGTGRRPRRLGRNLAGAPQPRREAHECRQARTGARHSPEPADTRPGFVPRARSLWRRAPQGPRQHRQPQPPAPSAHRADPGQESPRSGATTAARPPARSHGQAARATFAAGQPIVMAVICEVYEANGNVSQGGVSGLSARAGETVLTVNELRAGLLRSIVTRK